MALAASLAVTAAQAACTGAVEVCNEAAPGAVALIDGGKPISIYVDADAPAPVARVAADFASDLEKVSGKPAQVVHSLKGLAGDVVVIGQIGRSPVIDGLIDAGKLKAGGVTGQWEAYAQAVVEAPVPGIRRALVIAGADPRGAVFGTYDISARMGVSPWYWWADVPVTHRDLVSVAAGVRTDKPAVKYRGFFINDEDPAFGGWAKAKYGGVNHQVYARVFELDLRLKGNYLWPAMWGKSIADDDPESLKVADQYGIVLGTSHHEPMTRAQVEWHRHTEGGVTGGAWDYTKNAENLRVFWRGGIERMVQCSGSSDGSPAQKCGHEDVVTVGMRGDGDEPMSEGTATQLLERIVADQRQIIADVTGRPAKQTPQVWALYKEVQDYYDHGMKVPDDVTLLFSDDNWGQIRRLPTPGAPPRSGGYGVYYHFDYVGGPRNYKWINTNQIEKTWQQMELAHESGADRLWIVNVGDIKPMEYPLSFFLDMAWNPDAMTPEALKAYPAKWAGQQFGPDHAAEIGGILTRYSQYNARKKPELMDATAFDINSLSDMQLDYGSLVGRADGLAGILSASSKDAYFQLVQYPVAASANLYDIYYNTALNHAEAKAGSARANRLAEIAETQFARDRDLAAQYNALGAGKWDHMMDQTHIGYTTWQQPEVQVLPPLMHVAETEPKTRNAYARDRIVIKPSQTRSGRFIDSDGAIAIEAEHFSRKVDGAGVRWQTIPDLGRTLSSVMSLPQTAPATTDNSMRLEYDVTLSKGGDATLSLYLAPTLDTAGKGGLRIAAGIDDAPSQILNFDLQPNAPAWNQAVSDNIVILKAPFKALAAGPHTLKIYRIDGNVVLERLVLDTGGLTPSYLGPPESAAVQ